MKRILSTWMAAARVILRKLLLILPVMAAAEIGLYFYQAGQIQTRIADGNFAGTFGELIDTAGVSYVFFAALAAVAVVCALQGCRFSGKNVYTLQRLPLGEWPTTLLWSAVHLACFVILWAAQLMVVFLLWRLFSAAYGSQNPGLELFVEFYDNRFLHSLLPLAETSRWIAVVVYGLALAYSTACFGFFQRRGRFRPEPLVLLAAYAMLNADPGSTEGDWLGIVIYGCLCVSQSVSVWRVYHNEETD